MSPKPRVGVSRCLLGDEVRYDGTHKRDSAVLNLFGGDVEWVPAPRVRKQKDWSILLHPYPILGAGLNHGAEKTGEHEEQHHPGSRSGVSNRHTPLRSWLMY